MLDLILVAMLQQAAPDPCQVGPPAAAPARCPRWRQVQLGRPVSEATGYVDPASLRRDGNAVELNTLTVLTAPLSNNVSRIMIRARFDCTARTTLVLHATGYDAAGLLVHDGAVEGQAPQPVLPGSPRATLMDEFCPR